MTDRISVGVITQEQGAHLEAYFGALAGIDEVARVVVADPSETTIALAEKTLGEKLTGRYADAATMLREARPALALVSMQADASPPAIEQALQAGCHVLAEKPACVKPEDFAALVHTAQSKHRMLMLALANRVHAPVREARRLVQAGMLGKIYGVELHLIADQTRLKSSAYRDSWFARKAQAGGGHLIWLGIHWLDLAMHITGLHARQVSAFTTLVGGQPVDVEDSATVLLRWNNGSLGTLTSGYYLDRGYHSHIQVWGEHGWLRLADVEEQPLEWYSTKDVADPKVRVFEYAKGERGYPPFVRAVVRAAAGLEEAPVSGEECQHVLEAIFACYRSAESGRVCDVRAPGP